MGISMNGRKGNYNIFINESKFDIMKELNIRENNFVRKGRLYQKFEGKKTTVASSDSQLQKDTNCSNGKVLLLIEKGFYEREYLRIRVVDQVEVDIACDYF